MGGRYDWTQAEALLAEGATQTQIARELGCALSTVSAWMKRTGRTPQPHLDRARALELYDLGMSDRQIARELCVGRSTVWAWRSGAGLPSLNGHLGRRPAKYDWARAEALYDEGLLDAQIAAELGCVTDTVGSWRRRSGRSAHGRGDRHDWSSVDASLSNVEIADALGCTAQAVAHWRRRQAATHADSH